MYYGRHEDSGKLHPPQPQQTSSDSGRVIKYEKVAAVYRVSGSPAGGAGSGKQTYPQPGNAKPVQRYGVTLTVVCLDPRRECYD